jgi:hypothetical protein
VLKGAPDITIEELRRGLAQKELVFGEGTIRRFLVQHDITRKKTAHASSPSSPGRLKRRLPIRPRAQGRYQPFPRRDQSGSTALHMDRRPSIHACFDDDIYRERGRLLAAVPHVL